MVGTGCSTIMGVVVGAGVSVGFILVGGVTSWATVGPCVGVRSRAGVGATVNAVVGVGTGVGTAVGVGVGTLVGVG